MTRTDPAKPKPSLRSFEIETPRTQTPFCVSRAATQAMFLVVGLLLGTACSPDDDGPKNATANDASTNDASTRDANSADTSTAHDAGAVQDGSVAEGTDGGDNRGDASLPPDAGSESDAGSDTRDKTLSELHPGDLGMDEDPSVVWFEDFEEGSLNAIEARYDQVRNNGRIALVSDTPNGTGTALSLRAGQGENAVDLYKRLPNADEWYVRWYVQYEENVPWHHSGMWFGGYNPSSPWPSPGAATKPNGDDRFSIAVEPVYDGPSGLRFDFYNYWYAMHSWMAVPDPASGTAYYGNPIVHMNDFTVDEARWVCLEVHVRLNPDPASGLGAMLEVWKGDALVQSFDDAGPVGYWIRDKFCPEGANGSDCTDYPAASDTILDLRFRTTTDLTLNAFWPQNYITDDAQGSMLLDQMIVATQRIGCMR